MREIAIYILFIVFAILIFPHIINVQSLLEKMYLSPDEKVSKKRLPQNSGLGDLWLKLADPVLSIQNACICMINKTSSFVKQSQKIAIFDTCFAVNKMQIFPNPANGYINIGILNYKENAELNIYDFSERRIIHSAISENENRIDVSSFNPGVCFARIGILAKRLIVV